MVKKFTIPFASQGDANDIPDALQVDGKVSFTQGFGYDYERPYDDPQAKDIAREDMNGIFKAITSAVGELQTLGASEWSNAIAYPKGAIVYFEKDLYISQVDDNKNKPPQSWTSIKNIADDSLKKAMNLADLTDKNSARNNLGLGNSATLNKTDILGTSSDLVATQKLVNDTKINLDNSVRAVDIKADKAQSSANSAQATANTAVTKADNAQSRADSAYNLANSKWSPQQTVGDGKLMREGAWGLTGMPPALSSDSSIDETTIGRFIGDYVDGKPLWAPFLNMRWSEKTGTQLIFSETDRDQARILIRDYVNGKYTKSSEVYTTKNTTIDKSGFLRASGSTNALTDQNNQQIGVGQKWVDVTSQRAAGTTYTNNTGKPIYVRVMTGDNSDGINIMVDGVVVGRGSRHSWLNMYAIIPSGSSYIVNGKFSEWSELR